MSNKKCRCYVFSPTGSTMKVVNEIAKGMGYETLITDVTKSDIRVKDADEFQKDDIVIIGAPIYGGTIPKIAKDYFDKLNGNNTPAVVVVTYGNRDYDNGLYDLGNICKEARFNVLAGGAFIGEHSMSTEKKPIAGSRPDELDLKAAFDFGKAIRDKYDALEFGKEIAMPNLPYDAEFKAGSIPVIIPKTNIKLCTKCNKCVDVCPTNARLVINDAYKSDRSKCIMCYACVKNCPQNAVVMKKWMSMLVGTAMQRMCLERKESEIFMD